MGADAIAALCSGALTGIGEARTVPRMLAAVLAALALQGPEPPAVVDGVPITRAAIEATGRRFAPGAAVLIDRAWLDGEAACRDVEPGPGARRRLAVAGRPTCSSRARRSLATSAATRRRRAARSAS